ncbi:MAG: DUF3857 domain-containing transglutaminase family protein [Bacteroidetes bacterium]|nr:DUF3857 domain-containing transglutaminase family protein [Bacteroidota bacterium]
MKPPQLITVSLVFLLSLFSYSQEPDFDVFNIPEELKENAHSVIRFKNISTEIHSQKQMSVKIEVAITIFDDLADDYADITIYYDKGTEVKSVKALVFNERGNEVKKIKKSDLNDYSASGSSLYSDNRVLYYDYTPVNYPYTIHYTYEYKTSNTAFIRPWVPIQGYDQSVEKSTYSLVFPAEITVRKSEVNFSDYDIIITEEPSSITYEVEQIKAIEREPYSPPFGDFIPKVRFGVNKFNLEGVNGEATNWQEFGEWYYKNLLEDTFDLPESAKQKAISLTEGTNDPIEKAKIIYNYVQDKVRYISIQVGVGGFKPMLASEVDRLGYGDCKALTNYTKSLLDAVGVPSNYTVIYGDTDKTDIGDEFLSIQGNHVVLNLPTENGDLWLECTSQKTPFADSGDFTDDRNALVICSEGGEIKHTRIYDDKENHQKIIGKYTLDNLGHLKANVDMVCSGTQFDNHIYFEGRTNKELEKSYKEFWDNINNMSIGSIDINNNKGIGKFEESVSFTAENYGVITGERMIFPINAFNVLGSVPKRMRNRKLPVEVGRGFYDIDEVEVELPSNYTIESISENIIVENEYGMYKLSMEIISENILKYKRELFLKSGNYPKESYDGYRNFWKSISKSDKSKIVLIKN